MSNWVDVQLAPFKAEYEIGLECGTLWDEWIEDMQKELDELKTVYGRSKGAEQ